MVATKENIIDKLKDMSVPDIITWMVENIEVKDLMECLRTINPEYVVKGVTVEASVESALGPRMENLSLGSSVPVDSVIDMTTEAGQAELHKIEITHLSRNSGIVCLGIIPVSVCKKTFDKDTLYPYFIYMKKSDIGTDYSNDKVKCVSYDMIKQIISEIRNPNSGKTISNIIVFKRWFRDGLTKVFNGIKNCKFDGKCELTVGSNTYDTEEFIMMYGIGDAWKYDESSSVSYDGSRIFQIYSEVYMKLPGFWSQMRYNKLLKKKCLMVAYDKITHSDRPYLVIKLNDNGVIESTEWYASVDLNTLEDGSPNVSKLTKDTVFDLCNEHKAPFSSRIYKVDPAKNIGPFTDNLPDSWKTGPAGGPAGNLDMRVYRIGEFSGVIDEDVGDIGASAGASAGGILSYPGPSSSSKSKFGALQRKAAKKNIYLTGVKFGSDENRVPKLKFSGFILDPNNAKWKRLSMNMAGRQTGWIPEEEVSRLMKMSVGKYPVTPGSVKNFTKIENFMSFGIHKETDIHLDPLPPMAFGFMQKALKTTIGRNSFGKLSKFGLQLYPLGKDAYIKGRHQGVSSNFSQKESVDRGLWNPFTKKLPIQVMTNQSQFSGKLKRKASSCFGKSALHTRSPTRSLTRSPNTWSNDVYNSYTGNYMNGIADNKYGYNGTQSVYGGNTGVVGYPAITSSQFNYTY